MASVPAIKTLCPDFRDLAGLYADVALGRRDGFTGMMAIYPAQIASIHEIMSPSAAEIAHARRIVQLFEDDPGAGVVAIDVKMIDRPHLKQARKIVAFAREECLLERFH